MLINILDTRTISSSIYLYSITEADYFFRYFDRPSDKTVTLGKFLQIINIFGP